MANFNDKVTKLLKDAEKKGANENLFFATTFKRYQVQMHILEELEKSIAEHGMTVTKEYVKGRPNLVSNPAITEYNKTATAANGTVSTLINILKCFDEPVEKKSKLSMLDDE